jgi:energy-coupling factor transporter ATP-binding protein EcfA2
MSRKITRDKAMKVVNRLKAKESTIIFYTDKIKISLPSIDSVAVWKERYPTGKIRMV